MAAGAGVGVLLPLSLYHYLMEGTNVEQGKKILRNSGMNFTVANGMKDGAEKVVKLAQQ